jgi:DNA (cytosine-5)-methyltransferase 1
MLIQPLRYISLFSGIGGLDLGLDRASLQCVAQVEQDDYCQHILSKHWSHTLKYRDVRSVGAHNLPRADVLAGGFPCQDLSRAGKKAGLAGARSGLWFEFHRIICELRPRYIVVENVADLLVRGIDRVLGDLAEVGYDAEWSTLSACAFGAPHTRERLFIIAYRHEIGRRGFGFSTQQEYAIRAGLNAWETAPRGKWRDVERWASAVMETGNGIAPTAERRGVVDGLPYRLDRIGATGNAVVPQIGEYIGRLIVAHYEASYDHKRALPTIG